MQDQYNHGVNTPQVSRLYLANTPKAGLLLFLPPPACCQTLEFYTSKDTTIHSRFFTSKSPQLFTHNRPSCLQLKFLGQDRLVTDRRLYFAFFFKSISVLWKYFLMTGQVLPETNAGHFLWCKFHPLWPNKLEQGHFRELSVTDWFMGNQKPMMLWEEKIHQVHPEQKNLAPLVMGPQPWWWLRFFLKSPRFLLVSLIVFNQKGLYAAWSVDNKSSYCKKYLSALGLVVGSLSIKHEPLQRVDGQTLNPLNSVPLHAAPLWCQLPEVHLTSQILHLNLMSLSLVESCSVFLQSDHAFAPRLRPRKSVSWSMSFVSWLRWRGI